MTVAEAEASPAVGVGTGPVAGRDFERSCGLGMIRPRLGRAGPPSPRGAPGSTPAPGAPKASCAPVGRAPPAPPGSAPPLNRLALSGQLRDEPGRRRPAMTAAVRADPSPAAEGIGEDRALTVPNL